MGGLHGSLATYMALMLMRSA
ncbi:hypothetical protein F383_39180 [Gossypium arboreum]|uniref:Uncharacterized protein n=1 Tax=Gossypium arboreum TaxID=29729 RepID=A0A0B0MG49_GOSAR|nr:hypothetical protein F383_39180 [Gossypium arboreum]